MSSGDPPIARMRSRALPRVSEINFNSRPGDETATGDNAITSPSATPLTGRQSTKFWNAKTDRYADQKTDSRVAGAGVSRLNNTNTFAVKATIATQPSPRENSNRPRSSPQVHGHAPLAPRSRASPILRDIDRRGNHSINTADFRDRKVGLPSGQDKKNSGMSPSDRKASIASNNKASKRSGVQIKLNAEEMKMNGAPQGPVYKVETLETEQIQPCASRSDAEDELRCIASVVGAFSVVNNDTKSEDWAEQYSAIDSVRRLAIHHQSLLAEKVDSFPTLMTLLWQGIDSGRSSVCRNALTGLREVLTLVTANLLAANFSSLSSAVESALCRSCSKDKKFIASAASATLSEGAKSPSGAVLLLRVLQSSTTNKNADIAGKAAVFMDQCLQTILKKQQQHDEAQKTEQNELALDLISENCPISSKCKKDENNIVSLNESSHDDRKTSLHKSTEKAERKDKVENRLLWPVNLEFSLILAAFRRVIRGKSVEGKNAAKSALCKCRDVLGVEVFESELRRSPDGNEILRMLANHTASEKVPPMKQGGSLRSVGVSKFKNSNANYCANGSAPRPFSLHFAAVRSLSEQVKVGNFQNPIYSLSDAPFDFVKPILSASDESSTPTEPASMAPSLSEL